MLTSPDHLMTTQEVAARLRVSAWTVIDWRRANRPSAHLPFVKVGRKTFYRFADVERLATNTVRLARLPVANEGLDRSLLPSAA